MKRSEMIKLLEQHLLEDHGLDFLTDKPIVVAKDILDFLEFKGMLPPFDDWTYHMDGDRANSESTKYLAWEPE